MKNPITQEQIKRITNFFNREKIFGQLKTMVSVLIPHRSDVKLNLAVGGDSFTDGETITVGLPEYMVNASFEEVFSVLLAILGHEAQHVNSSDFKGYKAYQLEMVDYFKKKYPHINQRLLEKAVLNIAQYFGNGVEDGRIEKISANKRQGFLKYYQYFRAKWWDAQPADGKFELEDFLFAIVTYATMGLLPKDFLTFYKGTEAEANIDVLKPKIIEGINAVSARQCLQLCKEMIYMVEPYLVSLLEKVNQQQEDRLNQMQMPTEYTTSEEKDYNSSRSVSVHFKPEKKKPEKKKEEDQKNQPDEQDNEQDQANDQEQDKKEKQGKASSKNDQKKDQSGQSGSQDNKEEEQGAGSSDEEEQEAKQDSSSGSSKKKDDKEKSKKDSNDPTSGASDSDKENEENRSSAKDDQNDADSDSSSNDDDQDSDSNSSSGSASENQEDDEEDAEGESNSHSSENEKDEEAGEDESNSNSKGDSNDQSDSDSDDKSNSESNDESDSESDESADGDSGSEESTKGDPSKDESEGESDDEGDNGEGQTSKSSSDTDGNGNEKADSQSEQNQNGESESDSDQQSNQNQHSTSDLRDSDSETGSNALTDENYDPTGLGENEEDEDYQPDAPDEDAVAKAWDDLLNEIQEDLKDKVSEDDNEEKKKEKSTEVAESMLTPDEISSIEKDYRNDDYNKFREKRGVALTRKLPEELKREGKKFRKEIEQIFKNKEALTLRGQRRGVLDVNNLYKVGIKDFNVFVKKGSPIQSDFVAYILQDGSGSMQENNKQDHSAYALAIMEEGLKGIVPFKATTFSVEATRESVSSFGDLKVTHHVVKDFHENSSENYAYNFRYARGATGGNKDGFSIRVATKEILKRPERDRILIILSDGLPTEYKGGYTAGMKDVKQAIKEARAKGILVVALMFGTELFRDQNMENYRYMYEKNIISCNPSEITSQLTRVLKKIVSR